MVCVLVADEHPYHIHVNHFQVSQLPAACKREGIDGANAWLRLGDYHDTLQLLCDCNPDIPGDCDELAEGAAEIRFFAADFGGRCRCPQDCPARDKYSR